MFFFYSGLGLGQTHLSLILAHAVLGTPFVVISVTATLVGFDTDLARAGASLGAGPFRVFRQIQLPLIAPGVISGALFAFAVSFDEVVTVLFLGACSSGRCRGRCGPGFASRSVRRSWRSPRSWSSSQFSCSGPWNGCGAGAAAAGGPRRDTRGAARPRRQSPRPAVRVLVASIGSAGDVHPFLAVALALRDRGHAVSFATNAYFAPLLERVGLPLLPVGTVEQFDSATSHPGLWSQFRGIAVLASFVRYGTRRCTNTSSGKRPTETASCGPPARVRGTSCARDAGRPARDAAPGTLDTLER